MSGPNSHVIFAEDLAKTYVLGKQEVRALCGVTFTIGRNEFVAIMGPSGSGKSTLMNLLGCLDTPTEGTYKLSGKLVSAMSEDELAHIRNKEIGFVFQVFNLLPRATAFRNVELPLIYSGIRKKEREEKTGRWLMRGIISTMSRALVNEPSLLLADEPTGNLDSRRGGEILALFHKIHAAGNTIIMVTHDRDVAEQAQRIIHIRDGQIERDERIGG
jgi:putative ABC transport system ATP-binding protein